MRRGKGRGRGRGEPFILYTETSSLTASSLAGGTVPHAGSSAHPCMDEFNFKC